MASVEREASLLAEAGLVVVTVDAPHHGARRSHVVDAMPNALELPGFATVLQLVREARDEIPTLVDHLARSGHDRVAIAGVSFGAFIALAAATIEPRLHAIVSVLGTPDWRPRSSVAGEADGRTSPGAVPSELVEIIAESPLSRFATIPPRPLMMLNGALDENVLPQGARALATKLRPFYESDDAAPLVHHEYPRTMHFPSPEVWHDMWSRAARFLGDAFARGS